VIGFLALREARSTLPRIGPYMLSIALGVAALVSIHSFRADVSRSIRSEAQVLMGADLRLGGNAPLGPALSAMVDSVERAGLRFLMAAIIPAWVIFELVPTKLANYALPLYPLLALLAGAAFTSLVQRRVPLISKGVATLIFAVVGGVLALLICLLPEVYGPGAIPRQIDLTTVNAVASNLPTTARAGIIAAVVVPLLIPLAFFRFPAALLIVLIAAGLSFHLGVRGVVAPNLTQLWVSERLSERLEELSLHPRLTLDADPTLVVSGYVEPSLVFMTDSGVVLTNPVRAAEVAAEAVGRGSVIESRERAAFMLTIDKLGASVVEVGTVEGFNYYKGRPVLLHIFRTTSTTRPASEVR